MTQTKSKSAPVPPSKELTPVELDLERTLENLPAAQRDKVNAVIARNTPRGNGNNIKLKMEGDTLSVKFTHADPNVAALMLMADLGTMDAAFYSGITGQIARIGSRGQVVDEANSNFLLSVVRAVQPRDELEALLAVQMGAIHAATMMMARRLNHTQTLPQQDAVERALNKLARTYAMQMEALKRYRSKGEQRVIVERVTVNKGGQAIVGTIDRGGRAADET